MTVAESAEMSVGVAVTIVVAVMVPVVATVVETITMTPWRIGLVKVVAGIEAAAPMIVTSAEAHIDSWTMHEHSAMVVAVVYGESPGAGIPCKWTIEPSAGHVALILPGAEDMAEVAVANIPPEP